MPLTMAGRPPVLVIGYGNPGRQDDGLGPRLAEKLEGLALTGVVIESDYQLNVEHAHDLANYRTVVFVDATLETEDDAPFLFKKIEAGSSGTFSTHSLPPETVLRLAQDLFQAETEAYVLGIKGYAFDEIAEGLTELAEQNLDAARSFLLGWIEECLEQIS